MGSIFRSEEMALCQLFIQPETVYHSVAALGEAGIAEFRDLNPDVHIFQRKFISELRRCEELERQLRYIETEVRKEKINVIELDVEQYPLSPKPKDIINFEAQFEKIENEILELSKNSVNLNANYLELLELKEFLERTEGFFNNQDGVIDSIKSNLFSEDQDVGHHNLDFVAGTVNRSRIYGLERMLWRVSRGNIFLRHADFELIDPLNSQSTPKSVFVAFFLGQHLKSILQKVCTGYRASMFPCPIDLDERSDMSKGVRTRLEDMTVILNQTKDHRRNTLLHVSKELPNWLIMIRKMKAVYYTMNMFSTDTSQKCLIAECWVPILDLHQMYTILSDESDATGSAIKSFLNVIQPEDKVPPTFNRTNKFTSGFQNLIDAYGTSSYREVNPALYTIITFPFLFAIMFGDMGHGIIMALFGAWMVIFEKNLMAKKIRDEIWRIFFGGRYIILLMGIFSIYTGFVYNDVFSKSMNIFGSAWNINYDASTVINNAELELNPASKDLHDTFVYPIGLDPAWQLATNKIIFLNSYKMKLSIIFGVAHMIFGVAMSVINMIHFKRPIDIFLQFLPQMLFLILLFAYMVFMMMFKWVTYGGKMEGQEYSPGCAPSVLILFINMMLFGSTEVPEGCKEFMFDAQYILQVILVLIAVLCIPWMLLGHPIYVLISRKLRPTVAHSGHVNLAVDLDPSELMSEGESSKGNKTVAPPKAAPAGGHGHDEEPMGEVFILSAIHTIEYVLSTISHTASYLRLWALSLAHAQLSEVLWTQVLIQGYLIPELYGGVLVYIIFGVWAFFTLAILVMMEGLSAFLHTLRLHWVEFMSKFFEGLGYKFQPFSFKAIIDAEDNPE